MAIFTPEELKLLNNADLAAEKFRAAKKLIAEGIKLLGGSVTKAAKVNTAGLSANAKKVLTALGTGPRSSPELRSMTKLKTSAVKAACNELRDEKLASVTGHGRGARWAASKKASKATSKKVEELLAATVH